MLAAYEEWISSNDFYNGARAFDAADGHIRECSAALARMRAGLTFVKTDAAAGHSVWPIRQS